MDSVIWLPGLVIFLISLGACEKTEQNSLQTDIAEEIALTDLLYDDIFDEVDDAMYFMELGFSGEGLKSASDITCKVITVEHPNDSTFWPRTVTIDYGDGCTGPNGRVRKGKIIVVVNQAYKNEEHYRITTFDNFYIDDFKVEGTKTISNEGKNIDGNYVFSVTLEDGKVIKPNGDTISRSINHEREWLSGSNTRFRWDDQYFVTGYATGVNHNHLAYTRTIVNPLYITLDCRWIRSGTVEINVEGKEPIILDYGEGACDRLATVTAGEETKTIRLHR